MRKIPLLQEISPHVKNMKQLEYSLLCSRKIQIMKELKQGLKKPYKDLIDVSWGDLHASGVKPLTFVRQVVAACLYPQLIDSDTLPVDVRHRAQRFLTRCAGGSMGSYTATQGIPEIVQRLSEFITRRDGGVPSKPENIFISPGSQWCLTSIINTLVNAEAMPRSGVLAPVPCHSTTLLSIVQQGAVVVPYYLSEEQGWALQVEELQRALESAKEVCNPVALYVINPGNPAGLIQSKKSMQEVVQFVSENRLFLLADEVYQDYVFSEKKFVSYKKVLSEMGPSFSDSVELASFHSASKGFMGECGLRGGYVELVNLDPDVMKYIYNLFSTSTCAPTLGQIALDLMTHPPQQGDPSYLLYSQEKEHIRDMLIQNIKRLIEVINSLPGFSCQSVEGGAFVFPRVDLPPKAIQKAKEVGMKPDTFYCLRLLEEFGVITSPGYEYGQKEGTYHIRLCVMATQERMEELLRRLTNFHTKFLLDFS